MEQNETGPPDDAAAVALLRRAADELEGLHRRVPPGRWATRGLLASRPEIVAQDPAGGTEHVAEARQRSARWIVAMAPAAGPPLMTWLRETADALDRAEPGTSASVSAAVAFASGLLDRLHPGSGPPSASGSTS